MTDPIALIGKRALARTAQGEPHGHGRVIAYTDRPTYVIERPDGTRFSWLATLCEEEKTGMQYVRVPDLKAGMRCSAVVNHPLYEIEDIAILNEEGDRRVTFSHPPIDGVPGLVTVIRYKPTDLVEVHLTLDEAVAEFHRLERAEADALQRGYDLGAQRSDMAALARSLGWRG